MRLEARDGRPFATAYDYIEYPKILSQPDADPDALVRGALDLFLTRNKVGTDRIAASVSGQGALVRFVKLPPVEEKKVPEIVRFEARQQIPFPLDEVVWDYQPVGGGEAVGGFAMETEVGLFAMKRDIVNRHLGQFQAAGAEVHVVQMAPLALCNYATYELLGRGGPDPDDDVLGDAPDGKKSCVAVFDVGTDTSNLVVTDGDRIIAQRPVPVGGNHLTRAISRELKLTFAKAEHLKRNAAKSPHMVRILRALRPVLTEFVGELRRSLGAVGLHAGGLRGGARPGRGQQELDIVLRAAACRTHDPTVPPPARQEHWTAVENCVTPTWMGFSWPSEGGAEVRCELQLDDGYDGVCVRFEAGPELAELVRQGAVRFQ